jgi:hypothetical protein
LTLDGAVGRNEKISQGVPLVGSDPGFGIAWLVGDGYHALTHPFPLSPLKWWTNYERFTQGLLAEEVDRSQWMVITY